MLPKRSPDRPREARMPTSGLEEKPGDPQINPGLPFRLAGKRGPRHRPRPSTRQSTHTPFYVALSQLGLIEESKLAELTAAELALPRARVIELTRDVIASGTPRASTLTGKTRWFSAISGNVTRTRSSKRTGSAGMPLCLPRAGFAPAL
jgi:hypothetical protein